MRFTNNTLSVHRPPLVHSFLCKVNSLRALTQISISRVGTVLGYSVFDFTLPDHMALALIYLPNTLRSEPSIETTVLSSQSTYPNRFPTWTPRQSQSLFRASLFCLTSICIT